MQNGKLKLTRRVADGLFPTCRGSLVVRDREND